MMKQKASKVVEPLATKTPKAMVPPKVQPKVEPKGVPPKEPTYGELIMKAGQGSDKIEEFTANVKGDQSIRDGKHNSDIHGEVDPICTNCDNSLPTIQEIFDRR